MRTSFELRQKLERSADQSGLSIAQEVERRLDQTFRDEVFFGGPELRRLALTLIANFDAAGTQSAASEGHADWSPRQWLADQECCRSAVLVACEQLLWGLPDNSDAELELTLQRLVARLLVNGFVAPRS